MRIGVVSTYPPRPCGIGMFSADLRTALLNAAPDDAVDIIAIKRDQAGQDAPEVASEIRQDVRGDYGAAARTLSSRGSDVVLIEHEYGIFGGEAGDYVLALAEKLEQPLVVTLHTVLSAPSVKQAETLRAICRQATLVTVFTETARRMVVGAGIAAAERVRVIPHGAPDLLVAAGRRRVEPQPALQPRPAIERLEGRTVLSTFGLISAGKGLELAIAALPSVVALHPKVLYLIAGQTHPEVVKNEGESYRLGLERQVRDLGLTDHVHFLDRFLTDTELAALLFSTDLYVTPYRSREQIVSGALTFAVAAGCPVVSTPYFYAEDLLGSGAGVLVPFEDPEALATAVNDLLDHPETLARARDEASRIGATLAWAQVGAVTLDVLREAEALGPVSRSRRPRPLSAPAVRTDHLRALVDDVGIIQHANGVVANRQSGYCVDDVARLAIVALGLDRELNDPVFARMLAHSLAFLQHAWVPTVVGMHNFMTYDRRWADDATQGDHIGRTVWALGEVVAAQPPHALSVASRRLMEQLLPAVVNSTTPRTVAFTVLGLARVGSEHDSEVIRESLRTTSARLLAWYEGVATDDWRWFEDILVYDNARLPQALIAAGHRLGDDRLLEVGLESLSWYAEQCSLDDDDVVRLVGNRWRRAPDDDAGPAVPLGTNDHEGDEQPLDAAALVEALVEALRATDQPSYGDQAVRAFEWFLGRNRLGLEVYDFATGGCHDGLGEDATNDNEGAESTLSFLQSLLALNSAGLQSSLPRL